jgi:hypothetical protein
MESEGSPSMASLVTVSQPGHISAAELFSQLFPNGVHTPRGWTKAALSGKGMIISPGRSTQARHASWGGRVSMASTRGVCGDVKEYQDGNIALLRIALSKRIKQSYAQPGRYREDVKALLIRRIIAPALYPESSSAARLIVAPSRRDLEGLEVGHSIVSADMLAAAGLNCYGLSS